MRRQKLLLIVISVILLLNACNKKNIDTIKEPINESQQNEVIYKDFVAFYWDIQIIDNEGNLVPLYSYETTPYKIYIESILNVKVFNTGEGFENITLGTYENIIRLDSNKNYYIRPVIVENKDNELSFKFDNNFNLINLNNNLDVILNIECIILNNQSFKCKTTFKEKLNNY